MKRPIARKLLLVDREDGSGGYNFMIENHDGRTMTKQLTPAQSELLVAAILRAATDVTRNFTQ